MSRRTRDVIGWVLLIGVAACWFTAFRPATLGGTTTWIVIHGSSMEPLYETGDLVVMRAQETYAVGDVVAYRVPDGEIGAGHVVVHRLVGGDAADGFEALGDANEWVDPWRPGAADILGRPWVVIPAVGRAIAFLHQPVMLGGLAAAVVVSMMVGRPATPRFATRGGRG